MALNSLFSDIMVLCLLLMAAFVIREFVRPLQRWFLPSSVVAGLIGLVLGPQVLGLIHIPETFSGFNSIMMRIIMTCVVMGVAFSGKRLMAHMDYALANIFLYGAQMIVGVLIMLMVANFWPGMPEGWGILGTFAYFGSHGGVAAAGSVLEELGSSGAVGIGLILATGGLIISMVVGMAVVNYGVRKGWATFVKEPQAQPEYFYRGIMPKENRDSIGEVTTSTISINPLAFHLSVIMLAYALGLGIFTVLVKFIPVLGKINAMLYGLVGGLILWQVMASTKLDGYVDKKILNQISGFCLEILICGSMATLELDLVARYWAPLLLHIGISCGLTIIFCIWYFKKINNPEWFEKCLMVVGTCTGSSPNGLALVRAIDPDSRSCVPEAHGVYNAVFWWNNLLTPILPAVIITSGAVVLMGIASLFVIGSVLVMFILFWRKKATI